LLRIFLAEDESIIRETLRDTVPWEQYGYIFSGEAGDGEMALPLIRQAKPDVLITDIRMPFMDGLALSELVSREFPEMKIVIISGYDDFEYARKAISIGVDRYLLKPITKKALLDVLAELKEKIEGERASRSYLSQFHREAEEYEQYTRRVFFERIVAGQLSVQEIYASAAKLDIDLRAQCYTIAFFSVLPEPSGSAEAYSEPKARLRDALLEHFLKYPEYVLLRWNLTTYAVLLKGDTARMEELVRRCVETVRSQYALYAPEQNWYVAAGRPTQRLSTLPACFEEVSRLWAYRHILPRQHVLTADTVSFLTGTSSDCQLDQLDAGKVDPAILNGVMQSASAQEVPSFTDEYIRSVEEALGSKPFCQYLMLSARFTAARFAASLGIDQREAFAPLTCLEIVGRNVTAADLKGYLSAILLRMVELRDRSSTSQLRSLLKQAVAYIDRHFAEESLSLNQVAREVNISANYLSAVFSQEMGATFTEYVTGKRMDLAKELLRTTDKRSGEVAAAVGYRDPHYFSFLFKKTQGCTPRDYRGGGRRP
jgi:YesN/AraC family two-component response regulator